jgi:hypothetical protein
VETLLTLVCYVSQHDALLPGCLSYCVLLTGEHHITDPITDPFRVVVSLNWLLISNHLPMT